MDLLFKVHKFINNNLGKTCRKR